MDAWEIYYRGRRLEEMLHREEVPIPVLDTPLMTFPDMTTTEFCRAVCDHYFGHTPYRVGLPEILVPWIAQQTDALVKATNLTQRNNLALLFQSLPQTQHLIDGEDSGAREKLNKVICSFKVSTRSQEVGRLLIGAYGCLRFAIQGFISQEGRYSATITRKLISILYAMRDDFPDAFKIDSEIAKPTFLSPLPQ